MAGTKRGYRLAVLAGYLIAAGMAAGLLGTRHCQDHATPVAQTSGGMWAFGDFLLVLFCLGLLAVVPTFQLLRALSRHEWVYRRFLIGMVIVAATNGVCALLAYAYPVPHSLSHVLLILRVTVFSVAAIGVSGVNLVLVFRSPLRKWPLLACALEGLPWVVYLIGLFR